MEKVKIMTKTEKITKLKNIVEGLENDGYVNVKRSYLIGKANLNGLIEKDTYIILKPSAKSTDHRGHYVVAKLLEILNKKSPKSTTRNVAPKADTKILDNIEPDFSGGVTDWVLPYSQDDIADELSLMGTTI